jgi:hypothetical protein
MACYDVNQHISICKNLVYTICRHDLNEMLVLWVHNFTFCLSCEDDSDTTVTNLG